MGISRTDDLSFLDQEFSDLQDAIDLAAVDTGAGYKEQITNARFRLLGSYDNAKDPTYEIDPPLDNTLWFDTYRALLRFEALTKIKTKLAAKQSWQVQGDGVNPKVDILFTQVNDLLSDVINELAMLGVYVGQVGNTPLKRGVKLRSIRTDFFEPVVKEITS